MVLFCKNFIFVKNGWKLSYYSRTVFQPFYQNQPFWSGRWPGIFQGHRFESFEIIELGPFLGAVDSLLAREQLAIRAQQSHHRVSHLNCSKGWCPFVKIFKSSKICENGFTKGFFLPFYWNPLIWTKWRLWLFSRCQIHTRCENWSRIIFRWSRYHFCTKIGAVFRMVCCTGSVTSTSYFSSNFIKGWGTFANILYTSKIGEIALTISKGRFFHPIYQNCTIWMKQRLGRFSRSLLSNPSL